MYPVTAVNFVETFFSLLRRLPRWYVFRYPRSTKKRR